MVRTDMEPTSRAEADDAIETAREEWQRIARNEIANGREIPVQEVPRELGDVAYTSCEATTELMRHATRSSYVVSVDIALMERRRLAKQLAAEALARAAAATSNTANRPSRRERKRRKAIS